MARNFQAEPIRLCIVEDHRAVAEALAAFIAMEAPDITVVGVAYDGEAAVGVVHKTQPDVVLMDLALPRMDGAEATGRILSENPRVRVLAFTGYAEADVLVKALQAGVRGVHLKTGISNELLEAIRRVACGETVLPETFLPTETAPARAVAPRLEWACLTPAEMRILDLASKSFSGEGIQAALGITRGTYRNYRRSIREKLGVADWHQAVVAYISRGTSAGR